MVESWSRRRGLMIFKYVQNLEFFLSIISTRMYSCVGSLMEPGSGSGSDGLL